MSLDMCHVFPASFSIYICNVVLFLPCTILNTEVNSLYDLKQLHTIYILVKDLQNQ